MRLKGPQPSCYSSTAGLGWFLCESSLPSVSPIPTLASPTERESFGGGGFSPRLCSVMCLHLHKIGIGWVGWIGAGESLMNSCARREGVVFREPSIAICFCSISMELLDSSISVFSYTLFVIRIRKMLLRVHELELSNTNANSTIPTIQQCSAWSTQSPGNSTKEPHTSTINHGRNDNIRFLPGRIHNNAVS